MPVVDGDGGRGASTVRLAIAVDGRRVPVPAGIGAGAGFHAPVRTVDASGVVHLDGGGRTLGQLLTLWGVRATERCLGAYCRPHATITPAGDLRRVLLVGGTAIAITVTTRG